jgi:hypothetical protein
LKKLRDADWFARVGTYNGENAISVSSWQEAIEQCSSDYWEDLTLEAANQYCERLAERSQERFRLWNDVVAGVKPAVVALVMEKTSPVVGQYDLPKVFSDCVRWDILHLCMEAEYADVYPPGFYASQAYWYEHGHFPCGWQGEFPAGKLVVY